MKEANLKGYMQYDSNTDILNKAKCKIGQMSDLVGGGTW